MKSFSLNMWGFAAVLMLSSKAISVAIKDSKSSSAFPLVVAEIQECVPFQSVSPCPPFVMICEQGTIELHELAPESSKNQTSTLELVLSLVTPITSVPFKRGLGSDEDLSVTGSESEDKPDSLVSGQTFTNQNDLLDLGKSILILFHKMKGLKVTVTSNPEKLESEFPNLKEEYKKLRADHAKIKSAGGVFSQSTEKQLDNLRILVNMMDLNLFMRFNGCSNQLCIENEPDRTTMEAPPKTKLGALIDKLEDFGGAMIECYDENGDPRISDTNIETDLTFVQLIFEGLKKECQPFISQRTILSRILKQDLWSIQNRLHDLAESVRLKFVFSSLPSQNIQDASLGNTDSEDPLSDDEKNIQKWLRDWTSRLSSAYENNPQEKEDLDLKIFQTWRLNLQEISYNVYSEIQNTDFPDSDGRSQVEGLLGEITYELSRKANSILLVATAMASDGLYQGETSLDAFAGLYGILKSDILFVELKLTEVLESLKEIKECLRRSEIKESRARILVQKELLQRLTDYIDSVEWKFLPNAEKCNELRAEAFGVLCSVETLYNHGIMEKPSVFTSTKEKQFPTAVPDAGVVQPSERG